MSPHDRQHRRPNTKVTGERSEAAFLSAAIYRNFGVAKPWGDSRRYDFILDNGEILIRIQVKCTESFRADAYETRATYTQGNQHVPYTKKDIDFIAAHVVPLDLWYIIPVEVCTPAPMLRFYPHRKPQSWMRLEQYKEAWHLILPTKGVVNGKIDLQACADESSPDDEAEEDEAPNGNTVIPSEENDPRSGSFSQSRDLVFCTQRPHDLLAQALSAYRTLVRQTPATTLNLTLAPWPVPKVRILAHRQGPHLLPAPSINSS
jgi:hypothetical protein